MRRELVAIVYHFYPHYRGPINLELLGSSRYSYVFVGDDHDIANEGIAPWTPSDRSVFVHAPSKLIAGRWLIQRGLLRLALRSDIGCIIYLGLAQALMTWPSALLARLSGKRVLFWGHGWTRRDTGLRDAIKRVFYGLADGLLLYGNRAKAIGVEKGKRPSDLYVVYNSLDYYRQKELRKGYSETRVMETRRLHFQRPELPMIICTTRLTVTRGLDMLLEALWLLKKDGHEVNLLLVGDGPECQRLAHLAQERQLAVRFYGECYDEVVLSELLMAANVTVAPGKVGLTAMHSLVYGIPVITHGDFDEQMPEAEAIIEGKTGAFYRRGDIADLARTIRLWTCSQFVPPAVRAACQSTIDCSYNPRCQMAVIEQAISGEPAVDELWRKWCATQGVNK